MIYAEPTLLSGRRPCPCIRRTLRGWTRLREGSWRGGSAGRMRNRKAGGVGGRTDKDLLVSGKECKISKGTHTYRHVHVWGKGKLHFEDKGEEIHFWATSVLVAKSGR